MSRWFRFYDDAMHDAKLLRLSDAMFRAWMMLLCFASKNDGTLPPAADIAIEMRCKPGVVAGWIAELVSAGLIDKTETGFAPHNWNGLQYKSDTSNERVKRYREKKCNVTSTVTVTAPEQSRADTEQSRADAPPAVSNSEKVLRTDLMEAFGPSRTPDLSRAGVWLSKGYSSTMIIEVVKEVLSRGTAVASLAYFDVMLAERHATRQETPSERAASAAKIDMDKVAEMFKKTGVWSKYAGPEPGMLGCRCPVEILQKHGLVPPSIQRMQ